MLFGCFGIKLHMTTDLSISENTKKKVFLSMTLQIYFTYNIEVAHISKVSYTHEPFKRLYHY